jgi:hypothetical protein
LTKVSFLFINRIELKKAKELQEDEYTWYGTAQALSPLEELGFS